MDGFDKYLTLDVRSTFWRPEGTHADLHSRDTLHSVYFSVPNEIVDEYGEMTGVHATWLNVQTEKMLITGNKAVYNAIEPHISEYIDAGSSEGANSKTINYAVVTDSDYSEHYGYGHYGTTAYNVFTSGYKGDSLCGCYEEIIHELQYIFFADNGDADNYDLAAEQIIGDEKNGVKGWLQTYTEKYGGTLVNNRFSANLFAHVDDNFTEVNITADESFKLSDVNTSTHWWWKLFGPGLGVSIDSTNEYNISAIQKVTQTDIDGNAKEAFCNKFYIDDSDYDEMKQYIKEATINGETVYLFRYMQTIYDSVEAREFTFEKDWAMARGNFWNYKQLDSNAYFAQMWIQLDFDIIDLTFTKNGVITVIPVVMSPIDIAADADHPVYTTSDDDGMKWWKIILGVILGLLVLFLLLKFAPGILTVLFKILIFIITLPFKLLGAIFKPIHNSAKRKREQRKAERQIEKERKRMKKTQKAIDERERKEQEKREIKERKQAEKERAKENKRNAKEQSKANKKSESKSKYSLADLDKMSDSELAELYYEEYGFDDSDIPDEFWDN